MSFRHRPLEMGDIAEGVRIVTEHPVAGPRYAGLLPELRGAWERLVAARTMISAIIEEVNDSHARICFVGVTVFVSDEFMRELKTAPLFWFGQELARRITRGSSPVLSANQVQEANTHGGLNLLVWEGCFRPEDENKNELHRRMMQAFLEAHRGYLLKEIVAAPMESAARLEWTLKTGGFWWDPHQRQYVESAGDHHAVVHQPHVVGVTRELDRKILGSWVGTLFDYHPPRLGFSKSEQRMLWAALPGRTDQELYQELGAAPSTIKKLWRSIYSRAALNLPELFSESLDPSAQAAERGREKRRRLLAHLREHPEELRPISRSHLKRS